MSTSYLVSIDLQTTGNLEGKLGAATAKTQDLHSSLGKIRDGFTGLVESAGAVAFTIGKWAGAAALGAAVYGVTSLNKELEETNISLAAIFNAQGYAGSFSQGMSLAADTVSKMKQDVKVLPGDLGQLAGVFKMIATPAAQAGASIDEIRRTAAKTMVIGNVMGLQMDMSSREMAMLLSGRAGAHNVLGARMGFIGDEAAKFNKLSASDRFARVTAELNKYQSAIDAYGTSFTGLFTTLKDNLKYVFLGTATEGPFAALKHTLVEVNHWFDENQLAISTFAQALSSKLTAAWEIGIQKIKEWYPAIEAFALNAWERIGAIWEKIQPYVDRFGSALKDALKDPGTIDKLVHLLELYALVKVGSAVGGISGIMGAASGIGKAGSAVGSFGRDAMGILGVGGAELAVFGAAIAAWGVAIWQGVELQKDASKINHSDAIARREAGEKVVDGMQILTYTNTEYQTRMAQLIEAGDELQSSLLLAAGAAREFHEMESARIDKQREEDDQYYLDRLTAGMPGALVAAQAESDRKKPPKHPGGAGVNINRVEINVAGNEDPSRVAYKVADIFAGWKRNPKTSAFVPNYSASR